MTIGSNPDGRMTDDARQLRATSSLCLKKPMDMQMLQGPAREKPTGLRWAQHRGCPLRCSDIPLILHLEIRELRAVPRSTRHQHQVQVPSPLRLSASNLHLREYFQISESRQTWDASIRFSLANMLISAHARSRCVGLTKQGYL